MRVSRIKKPGSDHVPRRVLTQETRIGLFVVSPKGYRVQGGCRAYASRCDCGATVYLPMDELESLALGGGGCHGLTCTLSPPAVAVTHNPTVALLRQIRHLLAFCPEDVDPVWGGAAYGEIPPNPEGIQQFIDDLLPLVDAESKAWWVAKFDRKSLWTVSNVVMRRRPSLPQFDPQTVYIRVGTDAVPLLTLARDLHVEAGLALQLYARSTSHDDLVETLIQESTR